MAPSINAALKEILGWVEANKEWIKTDIVGKIRNFAHGADDAAKSIGGWANSVKLLFDFWLGSQFLKVLSNVLLLRNALGLGAVSGGGLLGLGALGAVGAFGAAAGGAYEAGKTVTESDEEAQKNRRGYGPIDMLGRGVRAVKRFFGGRTSNSAVERDGAEGHAFNGSTEEVRQYIRAKAQSLGIDPTVAEQVARSEGLNSTLGAGGDGGTSDGPFQLHVGGGIGDDYQRQTGHSIHDKRYWRDQVELLARART